MTHVIMPRIDSERHGWAGFARRMR